MHRMLDLYELLTTVEVIRRSGHRRVRHQVNGQGGDVRWADHAADRECRAELLASRIQLIAEQGGRKRSIDEAGGDQVDAHRGQFEREVLGQGWKRGCESRDESEPWRRA